LPAERGFSQLYQRHAVDNDAADRPDYHAPWERMWNDSSSITAAFLCVGFAWEISDKNENTPKLGAKRLKVS
jgi:hypothetical protein